MTMISDMHVRMFNEECDQLINRINVELDKLSGYKGEQCLLKRLINLEEKLRDEIDTINELPYRIKYEIYFEKTKELLFEFMMTMHRNDIKCGS